MSNNSTSNTRNLLNFNLFNRHLLATSTLVVGLGFSSYAMADGLPVPTQNTTNIAAPKTGANAGTYGNATVGTAADGKYQR